LFVCGGFFSPSFPTQHEFCKKYFGTKKRAIFVLRNGGGGNQGLGHFIQELFPRVDKYLRILGNFFSGKLPF
jgi:hypothetical protein